MKEFIQLTILDKNNINCLFEILVQTLLQFQSRNKHDPTVIENLSKLVIMTIHFENVIQPEKSQMIQQIIDNFEKITGLLLTTSDKIEKVMKGNQELPKVGMFRIQILKILEQCFWINFKKFNLFVSTSNFGNILENLMENFNENDYFILSFYNIIQLIMKTEHVVLINNCLSIDRIKLFIRSMRQVKNFNKLILLKFLKFFDRKFEENLQSLFKNELAKEGSNANLKENLENETPKKLLDINLLTELSNDKEFSNLKMEVYHSLKNHIKVYLDLDEEIKYKNLQTNSVDSYFSSEIGDETINFKMSGNSKQKEFTGEDLIESLELPLDQQKEDTVIKLDIMDPNSDEEDHDDEDDYLRYRDNDRNTKIG